MAGLNSGLRRVAEVQQKHAKKLLVVVLILTLFMAAGLPNLKLQTDFSKEMPQDLPITKLNDRVADTFSGQDTMIVLLTLDDDADAATALRDIRDQSVIEYLTVLEDSLKSESDVVDVVSPATYLRGVPITSNEMLKEIITTTPAGAFVSDDYETMLMFVSADVGAADEKIIALDSLIRDKVESAPKPPGVDVMVTGTPQIMVTLFDLLGQDALNTIIYASIIILILLFIIQKSIVRGIVVFTPLVIGLIWAYGTLGWLDIRISIATAGLGAIILGLGVEYGAFMLNRYREERATKTQLESLQIAVPSIGRAIMGSGVTTIVGFLALTFSVMPMLQNLGFSLAIGIFYSLLAAIFVQPLIIVFREGFMEKYNKKKLEKYKTKVNRRRK